MTEHVKIVPYDPSWPRDFEVERARIASALGEVARRIEHNGSTAVPGLASKPVIDIQVSVDPLHPSDRYTLGLARLGYIHVPHPDDAFCPFFHRPHNWPHTHHVHTVQAGGDEERRTLAFRDFLRDREHVAREYEELKRRLAPGFSTVGFASRQAYADAKGEFVNRIVDLAFSEGYPHGP